MPNRKALFTICFLLSSFLHSPGFGASNPCTKVLSQVSDDLRVWKVQIETNSKIPATPPSGITRLFGNPRTKFFPPHLSDYTALYWQSREAGVEFGMLEIYLNDGRRIHASQFAGDRNNVPSSKIFESMYMGLHNAVVDGFFADIERVVFTHTHPGIGATSWSNVNGRGDIPFAYEFKAFLEELGMPVKFEMILVRDSFMHPGQAASFEGFFIDGSLSHRKGDYKTDPTVAQRLAGVFINNIHRNLSPQ